MTPPTTQLARRDAAASGGFTLIELLVVIAVVALLMGILLPALGKARKTGAMTRESSALRQAQVAWQAYANDSKDVLLPGYLRGSWADPVKRRFIVPRSPSDSSEEGRLTGTAIRPYTWRLRPYLNYVDSALVADRAFLRSLNDLPQDPADPYGYEQTFARHPAFGLNTTYVGGDAHRGGFYIPAVIRWGAFYVTRIDQVTVTDRLIVFATSRGVQHQTNGAVVPGFHRIEAPWHATPTSNSIPAFIPWLAPRGRFDASLPTTSYGHVDFRHFGKTLVSTVDGHVEALAIDQLYDMRRWSNKATKPEWRP